MKIKIKAKALQNINTLAKYDPNKPVIFDSSIKCAKCGYEGNTFHDYKCKNCGAEIQ